MAQQYAAAQNSHVQRGPEDNTSQVIEQFRRYHPPTFDGRGEPTAAEEWLHALERIFNHIPCSDAQRISCATFQLVEDADHWWESHTKTMPPGQQTNLTWGQFQKIIIQKYIPSSYRDQKESEFLRLRQGGMTVVEYDRKFSQLSRYADHLVDTDTKKAQRFEKGLRPEISCILAGLGQLTYAEVLDCAQKIEFQTSTNNVSRKSTDPTGAGKRKWGEGKPNNSNDNYKHVRTGEGPNYRNPGSAPTCPACGRNHMGACLLKRGVCFRCKQLGHHARNCPRPIEGNDRLPPPPPRVRAYAMTQHEASTDPGTMAGMLSILGMPVLVLFDTGATHSFISTMMYKKLGLKGVKIDDALVVSIPSGKIVIADTICMGLELGLEHKMMHADLYVLTMKDFDIILGMDWLGANHAIIKCHEKEVAFHIPGKSEYIFYGAKVGSTPQIISAMKTTKMLRKKTCEAFLVSLEQIKPQGITPEQVPIIREYQDVFPEDLPGLPPDQQVEVTIELAP